MRPRPPQGEQGVVRVASEVRRRRLGKVGRKVHARRRLRCVLADREAGRHERGRRRNSEEFEHRGCRESPTRMWGEFVRCQDASRVADPADYRSQWNSVREPSGKAISSFKSRTLLKSICCAPARICERPLGFQYRYSSSNQRLRLLVGSDRPLAWFQISSFLPST